MPRPMRKSFQVRLIPAIALGLALAVCQPLSAQIYACDAGPLGFMGLWTVYPANQQTCVNVIYQNFGTDTIPAGALQVNCMVNYGIPSGVMVPVAIPPGKVDSIPVCGIWFPPGFNTLCAFTNLVCDSNPANDSLCHTQQALVYTAPPWFDDFETNNPCVIHPGGVWQWGVPTASIIDTAHSGTRTMATILNGTYPSLAEDYFYTPVFTFPYMLPTDTYRLSFWHWCAQADTGEVSRVEYSTDAGVNWNQLGFITDPMGANWYNNIKPGVLTHYFHYLNSGWMYSSYKITKSIVPGNGMIQFRFKFSSNSSGVSDGWAVDDLGFEKTLPPDDVGVVRIEEPVGPLSTIYPDHMEIKPYLPPNFYCSVYLDLQFTLKNFGSNPQTSIPISFTLFNGGPVLNTTWTGNLLSGDTVLHSIPQIFPAFLGKQNVTAYSVLSTDLIAYNDTSSKKYVGTINYCMSIDELVHQHFIRLGQNTPNPASITTKLPCHFPTAGRVRFGLTDLLGRELFSDEVNVPVGEMDYTLDVSGFPPGMYIYFAEFEGRRASGRMMVMRL